MFFIELSIEAYSLYKKDLVFFVLFTILLTQSITDYINHDVYSVLNYCLALLMFILASIKLIDIVYSLTVPIGLFVINKFIKGMGSGDLELLVSISFVFNFQSLLQIVFLSSLFNLLYSFFVKKDSYSFVPFLSISCLIIYLFK